jgi:hypothetical protein
MIAANQANSLKSTGPVTERGQLVSRRNALKQGGEGPGVRGCQKLGATPPRFFGRTKNCHLSTEAGTATSKKPTIISS